MGTGDEGGQSPTPGHRAADDRAVGARGDEPRGPGHGTADHRAVEPPAVDHRAWQPWVDAVCASVDVDPSLVDMARVQRLTRAVSRAVARPMAPVSAYLLGLAQARGTLAPHDVVSRLVRAADQTPDGDPQDEATWDAFVARACEALGLDATTVPVAEVLALTRSVAHAGLRPVTPVSALVLGLARGAHPTADGMASVVERAALAAPTPTRRSS